jgi:hypothetical protein
LACNARKKYFIRLSFLHGIRSMLKSHFETCQLPVW